MKLETKRLILREPKKSDWKDLVEGVGECDVAKMLSTIVHPYTKKDAIEYIQKVNKRWKQKIKDDYSFFIELKSEKKMIGAIGIHKIDIYSGNGTTGSWINKKYWRNGYMTEAKVALNDFAFNKLKFIRLNSSVATNNVASNATQLKMGYKLEGMQRKIKRCRASGKLSDQNMYGLLKEDWKKTKAKIKC
ncbi:MAG: GNAT family protein [Candidatus Paceibacterota bacterium]|jgi:ribosomal-protein-alanine N-acetyltransferase